MVAQLHRAVRGDRRQQPLQRFRRGAAWGEAIRFAVAMAIGQIVGRSAWAIRNAPAVRWWSMIVPLLVVAGLTMTAADFTLHWLAQPAPRPTLAELGWTLVDRIGRPAMLFVWVFAINVLMLHLALLQSRHRAQASELVEARAAAAQAQLAMLRYQLNPHFLFNTLNAISTLVITGRPAAAEEMLSKLSRFLRASLASEPGDFVTLDAELGMLQEYLEIEGVRFGERLEVDFACDAPAAVMKRATFRTTSTRSSLAARGTSPSLAIARPIWIDIARF